MNDNERLQEKQIEDQKLQELSNEELKEKIEENSNNNGNITGTKKSGASNILIVVLIIFAGVIGFFWMMWPNIQRSINGQWNDVSSNNRNTQSRNRR